MQYKYVSYLYLIIKWARDTTPIDGTITNLDEQREDINAKLLPAAGSRIQIANKNNKIIKKNKRSIRNYINYCSQALNYINQIQEPGLFSKPLVSSASETPSSAHSGKHMTTDLDPPKGPTIDLSNPAESRAADKIESIQQCLATYSRESEQLKQNRFNIFEDVKAADDAEQVIVATPGNLISAKRVTAGPRSRQWLGQMPDAQLQNLIDNKCSACSTTPQESSGSASVVGPGDERQRDEQRNSIIAANFNTL
ncbi:hypothetical protein TWF481_002183 [Arthrobotrys musiformis]|uniref:Uncharacterized protein n=1 Tax=Arthrobotrys musiformis TaxID=47236 RepID=A0AAV9VUG6_9PEZI